ncbi:MAG: hypothetical protein RR224_11790 [Clostridia bacterium]
MALKFEELLRKIALPKRYFTNNFIIADQYKEEVDAFVALLSQCSGSEFNVDKQLVIAAKTATLCETVKQNIEHIINAISFFENADLKSAQEEFDTLLNSIKDDIFISTIDDWVRIPLGEKTYSTRFRITPGYRYFRVRPVNEICNSISQNADELFHIPLSKRAYTNNERFSLAGFPSLYLSTMLPLAWQECGYPSKYYYSEYQYNYSYDPAFNERLIDNELRFISLYSPDEICNWGISIKYSNFDLWLEVIIRYLNVYPLVLACSFVNQSGKVPYKQEYIVPQMLMQWVQRNNPIVQGISYFTCVDTSMWTMHWCAYNLVVPAIPPYDDKMYSCKLREKFCWTKPQFFTVPIADAEYNKHDRMFVYHLLTDMKSAVRIKHFPTELFELFNKMMNVCSCLMSLLDNGATQNMQLALHILTSIDDNCRQLKVLPPPLIHRKKPGQVVLAAADIVVIAGLVCRTLARMKQSCYNNRKRHR